LWQPWPEEERVHHCTLREEPPAKRRSPVTEEARKEPTKRWQPKVTFACSACGRRLLNLYVWDDVLRDWTPGIIFALAPSLKAARARILHARKKEMGVPLSDSDSVVQALQGKPKVYLNVSTHRVIWGGA
jgi:hypothetical protein